MFNAMFCTDEDAAGVAASAACPLSCGSCANVTRAPTKAPTKAPTRAPTRAPSASPTSVPTETPTSSPTAQATAQPPLTGDQRVCLGACFETCTAAEPVAAPAPEACTDQAGWTNGVSGLDCGRYEAEGWCENGAAREQWTVGAAFAFPEHACCVCGGGNHQDSAACADTPGWENGVGLDCDAYQTEGFCDNGAVLQLWAVGFDFNLPEANCCACGKI